MRDVAAADRVQVLLNQLAESTPEEVASKLLQFHAGDARVAESDAWSLYDRLAGGTWGLRPDPKSDTSIAAGRRWVGAVIDAILAGREMPAVERRPALRSTFPY